MCLDCPNFKTDVRLLAGASMEAFELWGLRRGTERVGDKVLVVVERCFEGESGLLSLLVQPDLVFALRVGSCELAV